MIIRSIKENYLNMNIIITDCENDKQVALSAVCREHFGLHNFTIHYVKQSINEDAPLSFDELLAQTKRRIDWLRTQCDLTLFDKEDVVYHATLQKGFIETPEGAWMLVDYVLFVKGENFFPGMSESAPIKKEVWPSMRLPKEARYKQIEKVYPAFRTTGFITCINGTTETDWYKQAFRTAVKLAIIS